MKPLVLRAVHLSFFVVPFLLNATASEYCNFHAAYFDAEFVGNYAFVEVERFLNDVVRTAGVIIRLDSLLGNRRHAGTLDHFVRWRLVDDYMKRYSVEKGSYIVEGQNVYIRFDDSVAINKALKELWQISDCALTVGGHTSVWMFSLHTGFSHLEHVAKRLIGKNGVDNDRPDTNLLWLRIEGDLWSSHHFYQHEKDGFWHVYTGLYLTQQNVTAAQKLLLERYDLETTITSHKLRPAILKRYAYR
ncbi:MAG: hypothetical protein JSV53_05460 [candidate division WOR-3 bacterium]|nr:MAG: hypothetical protein JSV53_05460 [candidate division WOR-3 bacterium]